MFSEHVSAAGTGTPEKGEQLFAGEIIQINRHVSCDCNHVHNNYALFARLIDKDYILHDTVVAYDDNSG